MPSGRETGFSVNQERVWDLRSTASWIRPGRLVHRLVREAIGVLVELAADVLERHAADAARQRARLLVERLQPGSSPDTRRASA